MEIIWHLRDSILGIHPDTLNSLLFIMTIVFTILITRWIVRRKQSAYAVLELRTEMRKERRAHAAEVANLNRELDKYMALAFARMVAVSKDGVVVDRCLFLAVDSEDLKSVSV